MNNIKEILDKKGKSIKWLSSQIGLTYSNTHNLVNREDLNSTKTETLLKVAEVLDIEAKDLYTDSIVEASKEGYIFKKAFIAKGEDSTSFSYKMTANLNAKDKFAVVNILLEYAVRLGLSAPSFILEGIRCEDYLYKHSYAFMQGFSQA